MAGAGISDWLSYYGENSIDQWMIPYFGASVYDDPAVYARSSAITFIKQAHTPTLAWWATATASAPRRSHSSSGMRCAISTCPRNWWSIPMKATALSTRPTGAT